MAWQLVIFKQIKMILLLPIQQTLEENATFNNDPDCKETLQMTIDFFNRIGYNPPWIGYYASIDGELVGSAAYKGKPVNNKIEIAYGTMPQHQQKGIGTAICKALVDLALQTDPYVIITARTLPENNYSTKILEKNQFKLLGTVIDPEDGEVWEWVYEK